MRSSTAVVVRQFGGLGRGPCAAIVCGRGAEDVAAETVSEKHPQGAILESDHTGLEGRGCLAKARAMAWASELAFRSNIKIANRV